MWTAARTVSSRSSQHWSVCPLTGRKTRAPSGGSSRRPCRPTGARQRFRPSGGRSPIRAGRGRWRRPSGGRCGSEAVRRSTPRNYRARSSASGCTGSSARTRAWGCAKRSSFTTRRGREIKQDKRAYSLRGIFQLIVVSQGQQGYALRAFQTQFEDFLASIRPLL